MSKELINRNAALIKEIYQSNMEIEDKHYLGDVIKEKIHSIGYKPKKEDIVLALGSNISKVIYIFADKAIIHCPSCGDPAQIVDIKSICPCVPEDEELYTKQIRDMNYE